MASTKVLLVEITVFDEDTGEVVKKSIHSYSGTYGSEVEYFFERIGKPFAKIMDPYYGDD